MGPCGVLVTVTGSVPVLPMVLLPFLVPIPLGSVAVDFPAALAAMSGYSDWPTRVIARRMGAGYTIGEVLL